MTRLIILLLISTSTWGQSFKLRFVAAEEGMKNPYIYSISQDKTGFLWAATSEGVIRYDGTHIETFLTGIEDNFITTTFLDSRNNLWIGHSQGRLTCYSNGKFRYVLIEGNGTAITSIAEDKAGNIWCAKKNDGLFRISSNFKISSFKGFNELMINSILIDDNTFYFGTDDGIKICDIDGKGDLSRFRSTNWLSGENIQTLASSSIGILIGTDNTAFVLNLKDTRKKIPLTQLHYSISANVQHLFEDRKGNIWVSTFDNGVFKISNGSTHEVIKNFNELNGLETNSARYTFEDREGNIWIGTYGLGLACIVEEKFSYHDLHDRNLQNNIYSICISGPEKFLGLEKGIVFISSKGHEIFLNESDGLPADKITALHYHKGEILAGTESSGVYIWKNRKKFNKLKISENELLDHVNAITSDGTKVWIATKGGLITLDNKLETEMIYTTSEGLPHNNVNHVFRDSRGTIWMGFPVGKIATIEGSTVRAFDVTYDESILNISCIAEDHQGQIWLGTYGSGVYRYDAKRSIAITTETGLRSNYCYLLKCDRQGNLWAGHRNGISAINTNDLSIVTFDKRTGFDGDCNFNSASTDIHDNIWFGTSTGIIRYSPESELRHRIPPVISITSLKISDREMNTAAAISLPFSNYKIKIDFKAVSLKEPTGITYLYKLEGQDTEWIETPLNNIIFNNLSPGNYQFLVKARKDNLESAIAAATFFIDQPLWKKPWFILSSAFVIISLVYYIVKLREKKLKDFQKYLKSMLDEKTKEVTSQKEELARKNKDITDSINYARRIQDAILPDISQMKKAFPESFVFYQPRDIVSGDFYWFDSKGSKHIVVCADATGHGVPGAFITMIGSTLIRDLYARHDYSEPSEILDHLHNSFKDVMKQHGKSDQLFDSMDVTIAEFDSESGQVRIASSMRPVFIHQGDQLFHIRAERTSEGGNNYLSVNKVLSKGDSVYLFTDGITDQFGGPSGKKIKTSGLKDLLASNITLNMENQMEVVKNYFHNWKKDHEQVDDVLMIGLRV